MKGEGDKLQVCSTFRLISQNELNNRNSELEETMNQLDEMQDIVKDKDR